MPGHRAIRQCGRQRAQHSGEFIADAADRNTGTGKRFRLDNDGGHDGL